MIRLVPAAQPAMADATPRVHPYIVVEVRDGREVHAENLRAAIRKEVLSQRPSESSWAEISPTLFPDPSVASPDFQPDWCHRGDALWCAVKSGHPTVAHVLLGLIASEREPFGLVELAQATIDVVPRIASHYRALSRHKLSWSAALYVNGVSTEIELREPSGWGRLLLHPNAWGAAILVLTTWLVAVAKTGTEVLSIKTFQSIPAIAALAAVAWALSALVLRSKQRTGWVVTQWEPKR